MAALALPMARGGDAFQEFGVRIGAVAFLALVAAIVLGLIINGSVAFSSGIVKKAAFKV